MLALFCNNVQTSETPNPMEFLFCNVLIVLVCLSAEDDVKHFNKNLSPRRCCKNYSRSKQRGHVKQSPEKTTGYVSTSRTDIGRSS